MHIIKRLTHSSYYLRRIAVFCNIITKNTHSENTDLIIICPIPKTNDSYKAIFALQRDNLPIRFIPDSYPSTYNLNSCMFMAEPVVKCISIFWKLLNFADIFICSN